MAFRGITSILNLFSKGIHNFLTLKFVENKGRVLENLVFLALKRKRYSVKKALLAGIKELELKTGLILTWDEKRLEKHNNYSLNIMPAWEWLLTDMQDTDQHRLT